MSGIAPDRGWGGVGCSEEVDTAGLLSGGAGDVSCGGWPKPENDWGEPKVGGSVFGPKVIGGEAPPGGCCKAPKAKGFGVLVAGVPKAGAPPNLNGAGEPVPEVDRCGVADD